MIEPFDLPKGDDLDAVHRELMRDWRYRYHYYRLWPYYTLVIWWQRFKSWGDRALDLDGDILCDECGRPLASIYRCSWVECPSRTEMEECV